NFPGVAIATYNWNFGAGATPATATGIGPHTVVYPLSAGNKTIVLTATTADGCVNTASKIIDNICFILPITLTNFTATWRHDYTALNWQIIAVNNFSRFEVERSVDGSTFSNIGQVIYTSNIAGYNYDDRNIPVAATNIYYRLKLVDADGKFSYSAVVVVRLNGSKNEIRIYPIPAVNSINAEFGPDAKGDYSLQLIDATGRIVLAKQVANVQGNQLITLQRGKLAAGVYILKIISSYYKQTLMSKVIFE
ncbi:MAG: T9SS type A sorting domain-containing protein, partial [Ferruginibacter sp.]